MQKRLAWIVLGVGLLGGCKKKEADGVVVGSGSDVVVMGSAGTMGSAGMMGSSDTTGSAGMMGSAGSGSAGSAGSTGSGSAGSGSGSFPLEAGESYYGGSVMATNLVNWKLPDGTIVQLGIVTTGKSTEGREKGVLRAYHDGSAAQTVDQSFTLDPAIEHWAELKLLANDRVLFRFGDAGKKARARNAVVLRWDADAKMVRVVKRWSGFYADSEPAWLATGEYVSLLAPADEANCLKVIARMVACEKDQKFRDSLFMRDDPAEKAAMATHYDTHVAQWKTADGAKSQCQKWATNDYVDTSMSDPAKLKRLAVDADMACGFFGAEVVDEGGLPIALTDPKPH